MGKCFSSVGSSPNPHPQRITRKHQSNPDRLRPVWEPLTSAAQSCGREGLAQAEGTRRKAVPWALGTGQA